MTVPLYMDEHVPRSITTGLRLRGVDVITTQDDGRRHAPDDVLLDRASELQRVLFSQDEDLLAEATRRQGDGIPFSGVIYAHQLGLTIGRCIQDLELIAEASNPEDIANRVEYLPL